MSTSGSGSPRADGELDAVFTALADPTRRHLLEHLSRSGPATATQLAEGLPISRQGVAKHLVLLSSAGLVQRRRVGRESRYSATTVSLTQAVAWLSRVGREWDDRLAALADVLDG